MSADDDWKAILDAQAKTDIKKASDQDKARQEKEAQDKATADAQSSWRDRQKALELRIRSMNEQMTGGRKLYPKTEKNGVAQIAVFSIYSRNHLTTPHAPRCEFSVYVGGGGKVVFGSQRTSSNMNQKPRATFDARTVTDDELAAHLFEFVKEHLP